MEESVELADQDREVVSNPLPELVNYLKKEYVDSVDGVGVPQDGAIANRRRLRCIP